jgi:hypothetical protein
MGILGGLFGTKHEPLPDHDLAARRIEAGGEAFEAFVASANDTMEVVSGDGPLYVFVGRPPKAFGVVWFEDGARCDVRSMMERGVMSRDSAASLVSELTRIYVSHSDETRYSYKVNGHGITVTPSEALYADVNGAVQRAKLH